MDIHDLISRQAGLISRRQALAHGLTVGDIQRLQRRREWARVFPGVYINHTGPFSESQREWAAILLHRQAALAGRTALRRAGIATGSDHRRSRQQPDIELVVPRHDSPQRRPGVIVTRRQDYATIVHPTLIPPTVRIEDAVLDIAQACSESQAVAVLSDACRSRKTTAPRLLTAARMRHRLRQRDFLTSVLDDAADGTHSLLEWRYRHHVEHNHALPRAMRQDQNSSTFRDVHYRRHGVIVELDGRLGHDLALDRWADLDRDVANAANGLITVRMGWGQVLEPCRTASAIAAILSARGWAKSPRACGPTCTIEA